MPKLVHFLMMSIAAGLALAAPQPGDADFPTPSPCERHTAKVEAVRTGSYDLAMIGDSITECVGDAGGEWAPLKAVWDKHYVPRHAINLGYSGYRTENILWNLENGELDFKTPPKVVMLLIGTNNTDDQHYPRVHTAEQVLAGTKAIVDLIRQRLPATKIIVQRILPCGGPGDSTTYSRKYNRSATAIGFVRRAGELVAKLADDKQVFWLDVNHVFLRPDGTINTELMPDIIHPNAAGAEARAQAIEPLLSQLMGDKPIVDAQTNTAVVPVPKLEESGYDWYGRHAEILKIKEAINPDLVFIGDSITHGWGGQPKGSFVHAQKNTLDAVFPGHRCLNLGFGWDRTQNVLWRLDHGELDGLHPRAVILHIGTNNLAETPNARRNTPAEIVAGIRQIIVRIRSRTPEAKIMLMAVFPRGQNAADPFRLQINEINKQLAAEFGNTRGITLLDIGPKLAHPDGTLSSDVMFDFLHLTDKGYQIWADAITPLLNGPASGSFDGAFDGQTQAITAPVAGTDEVPVYQTVRFNFDGYYLQVPNGTYTVTLKFVEPFYDKAGARVFGVRIQEKQVIETLDIFVKAGKNQALDLTFKDIEVMIGALRIDFTRQVEFPCIAGIVIDGTTKAGQPFTRKINCGGEQYKDYEADRVANWASGGYRWPSTSPTNCPFRKSSSLDGIVFTGRHAEYTGADTWYPSWASDGNLYSSWTDGNVNGLDSLSGGENSRTGYATILGNDPLDLKVVDQGVYKSDPSPYLGRYPCGTLVYNGVWYYGTYGLHPSGDVKHEGILYNWPWLGPLVGFRYSTDLGKTWTRTPCTPEKPLFGEHALHGEPVKFGAPHFVDFGKNMEHSPDGKAYIVGHGASDGTNRRFGYNSWITGDEIYIARVTPGIENMNDMSKYEFFDGSGWTKDFNKTKPIAAWRDHMGCVTMTYNAPLKKYLMCVTDGGNTTGFYSTYILESDTITGPFRMSQYLYHFGEQAYFVNIPSKFISADGLTLWLCYAANFAPEWNGVKIKANPPGSRYGMCLQEINLLTPEK